MAGSKRENNNSKLRLGIAGLVHDHVKVFLTQLLKRKDVVPAGIAEPNEKLASEYREKYGLGDSIIYHDLCEMLDKTRPDALAIFSSTFDHPKIVENCASRGIDVMMEKPLAISNEHALIITDMAKKTGINIIVNYETTWYPANAFVYKKAIEEKALGDIRKIIFHTGHFGPREMGCSEDFLEWLTDPKLNGAGALFDFGCYGANIATWLLENQKPISVTAVTQQIRPKDYPKVDDEATILLTYPRLQVIIQASWNWTYDRKDLEIYGTKGVIKTIDRENLILRINGKPERKIVAKPIEPPLSDPLSYLAATANGRITPQGLSCIDNNMIVTEILDAARRSAQSRSTIMFPVDG